jgi:regulator of nonsense transcripts 1
MTNESGQELIGHADGAKGRTTDIKFKGTALTGKLAAVRAVRKEELTNTEKARDEFILLALRGELQVTDARFL